MNISNKIFSGKVYETLNIPWDVIQDKSNISSSSPREEKILRKKSGSPEEITQCFSEPPSTILACPEGLQEWCRECGVEFTDTAWGVCTQGGWAIASEEAFAYWAGFEIGVEAAWEDKDYTWGSIIGGGIEPMGVFWDETVGVLPLWTIVVHSSFLAPSIGWEPDSLTRGFNFGVAKGQSLILWSTDWHW